MNFNMYTVNNGSFDIDNILKNRNSLVKRILHNNPKISVDLDHFMVMVLQFSCDFDHWVD